MELFKPAWKNKNPQKRIKGIGKLNNEEILQNIAATDPCLEVRLAAIEKIMDEVFLAVLCLKMKNNDISKACFEKIEAKELLFTLTLKDQSGVAKDCLTKLGGSLTKDDLRLVLFEAADLSVRKYACSLSEDYNDLLMLALNDQTEIAQNCVVKLENFLSKGDLRLILFEAKSSNAISAAVCFLENHNDLLEEALLNHPDSKVKSMVATMIRRHETPSIFLAAILKASKEGEDLNIISGLMETIISNLKQDELLALASDSSTNQLARKTAIHNLTDKTPLQSLALCEEDPEILLLMIKGITDNNTLFEIYKKNTNDKIKNAVVNVLTDEKLLLVIAHNDKNSVACEKLGGYLCSSCHQENLPEVGQSAACVCKHCQVENHNFRAKGETTEQNRSSETWSRWDECTRCGTKCNYQSGFRYTDW